MFGDFLGSFEKRCFLSPTVQATFCGNFWHRLGYHLFQHLVTLLVRESSAAFGIAISKRYGDRALTVGAAMLPQYFLNVKLLLGSVSYNFYLNNLQQFSSKLQIFHNSCGNLQQKFGCNLLILIALRNSPLGSPVSAAAIWL